MTYPSKNVALQPAGGTNITMGRDKKNDTVNMVINQFLCNDRLNVRQCSEIWEQCSLQWNLRDNHQVEKMFISVMTFLLLNGTRQPSIFYYQQQLMICGKACNISVLADACQRCVYPDTMKLDDIPCNDSIRRFARSNASFARNLILMNSRLCTILNNIHPCAYNSESYNFDFADGCDDIPYSVRAWIKSRAKKIVPSYDD